MKFKRTLNIFIILVLAFIAPAFGSVGFGGFQNSSSEMIKSLAQTRGLKPILISNKGNYYLPGKWKCFGVLVADNFVCWDLVTDAGRHAGCDIKNFGNNRPIYCLMKKSLIPKRPAKDRDLAFKKFIIDFYNEHASQTKAIIKIGEQPAGHYEQGSYSCFGVNLDGENECNRLFIDTAIHLKCMRAGTEFTSRSRLFIHMGSARACIMKKLRIRSSGKSVYKKVFQDFYAAHTKSTGDAITAAQNDLTEIPRTLDGHHRAKGFSNIYGSSILCPRVQRIETHINVNDGKRLWSASGIRKTVAAAYNIIEYKSRQRPVNLCLKKPISFAVKVNDEQIYAGQYDQYRTNKKVFMDGMSLEVVKAVMRLQSGNGKGSVYALMQNSNLMRSIGEGTLKYKSLLLRNQVEVKQLFFIYHNKFYKQCIVPAQNSNNAELRKQAMLAGFFGKVVTTVTRFSGAPKRVKSKKTYDKLDVKPQYVEQYVALSNYFHKSVLPLLSQGYGTVSIQSNLATDIDTLIGEYKCYSKKLNEFERSLSHFAAKPMKRLSAKDVLDGFVKK